MPISCISFSLLIQRLRLSFYYSGPHLHSSRIRPENVRGLFQERGDLESKSSPTIDGKESSWLDVLVKQEILSYNVMNMYSGSLDFSLYMYKLEQIFKRTCSAHLQQLSPKADLSRPSRREYIVILLETFSVANSLDWESSTIRHCVPNKQVLVRMSSVLQMLHGSGRQRRAFYSSQSIWWF